MAFQFLVSVLTCVVFVGYLDTVYALTVKAYCQPSSVAGSEFKFAVRVKTDGDSDITNITAVDASVDPNSGTPPESSCMSNVEESSGIFALIKDIDVDSLTCGVVSAGGSIYDIQILAGSLYYYQLSCDTSNLFPTTVSVQDFATTGVVSSQEHHENPYGVKFQAFEADGNNSPARTVDMGQDIILRMIYNTEDIESIATSGTDNMGWSFHTVFTTQSAVDAELVLQIITPGLGTKVHITGKLPGNTIDIWTSVKHDSAAEITIPVPYQATDSTLTSWAVVSRGLKIEARDDIIGVLVRSSAGGSKGSDFVVFPDDILGDNYRPFSSNFGTSIDEGLEVFVVGTEAGTNIAIAYNGFTRSAGFYVDGIAAESVTSTDVNLDEYEVLHILCDTSCSLLQISADKNIAMVSGWEDQGHNRTSDKGHSSTQVIPTKFYSDMYVVVTFSSPVLMAYHIQSDDPAETELLWIDSTEAYDVGTPTSINWYGEFANEVQLDKHVSMYLHATSSVSGEPSLVQYPSISQWSIHNSFYVEEGVTYTICIATTHGDATNIAVSIAGRVTIPLSGFKLGDVSGFAVENVSTLISYSGDPRYEYYETTVTATSTSDKPEAGLVEFSASKTWKPFMMLVYEKKDDYSRLHHVFGGLYAPTNPCTGVTPVVPGDRIDNDCDGKVDEEFLNGKDEDGDGSTDEDLALGDVIPFRGIYMTDLLVDDNAEFSSPTTIQSAGCNVITEVTSTLIDVGDFTHNTGLHRVFDKLWVIETPRFNAFKYMSSNTIYFRVTYDFCLADLSLCENSCTSSRKRKRSTRNNEKFVDLMLTVNGNSTNIRVLESNVRDVIDARNRDMKLAQDNIHPCAYNVVYWLPVTLLLTITSLEAVMTVVFMHMRSKIKNSI